MTSMSWVPRAFSNFSDEAWWPQFLILFVTLETAENKGGKVRDKPWKHFKGSAEDSGIPKWNYVSSNGQVKSQMKYDTTSKHWVVNIRRRSWHNGVYGTCLTIYRRLQFKSVSLILILRISGLSTSGDVQLHHLSGGHQCSSPKVVGSSIPPYGYQIFFLTFVE